MRVVAVLNDLGRNDVRVVGALEIEFDRDVGREVEVGVEDTRPMAGRDVLGGREFPGCTRIWS